MPSLGSSVVTAAAVAMLAVSGGGGGGGLVEAVSLADVCTNDYAMAALPASGFLPGITIDSSSVNTTVTYNYTVSNSDDYPNATYDYCQVQFSYSHDDKDDQVNVRYWVPAPDKFQNRFLATGGAGYAINSGSSSVAGGIPYGAVSGYTDGGFGSFDTTYATVALKANGSLHYDLLYQFGYVAIHELTVLGKEFTSNLFNVSSNSTGSNKLYSYYQGCSEGGRDGWSQVQRFYDELDGVVVGAPAFRFAFQQVNHLYGNVIFQTLNYTPPPCEMAAIVNYTIAACDPLDGKTDGVVSRSDLCALHFDLKSLIGKSYYCAATAASTSPGGESASTPAQNGTISALGVQVAQLVADGLHDSQGRRVYLNFRLGAEYSDETATWDNDTQSWYMEPSSLGGGFVTELLFLQNLTNLDNVDGVTYDTLRDWIYWGWQKYDDVLQTTWPDLTQWQQAGKKILHYHGEADPSIPTGSSVHYHESVRKVMYPSLSYNESTAALSDWYQLYLVPGAGHCGTNDLQPNGPFPQTNLATIIDWVERNNTPTRLNATFLDGDYEGKSTLLCPWPLRPYWSDNSTVTPDCVYDQASIDTWLFDFDAFKMPVY